jgi:hypothetical protein
MNRNARSQAGSFRWALWGDVPAVLDSIWRRAEFYMYRPGRYVLDRQQPLGATLDYRRLNPAYSVLLALYALLTVFLIVGPTINTFCGLWGRTGLAAIKIVVGLAAVFLSGSIVVHFQKAFGGRLHWRLGACGVELSTEGSTWEAQASVSEREYVASQILRAMGIVAAAPPVVLVVGLLSRSSVTEQCADMRGLVWPSAWQLMLIVLIPLLACFLLCGYRGFRKGDASDPPPWNEEKATLRTCQSLSGLWILAIASLLPWALAGDAREAKPGPYLQTAWIVMLLLIVIVLGARRLARSRIAALPDADGTDISLAMGRAELLNVLEDPNPPPPGHVWTALLPSVGARPLVALLLPAMFAMTVPRSWLWECVIPSFLFSALIVTYGALRPRWEQVIRGIRRWFFVGLSLPVSLIVIVLAGLRIANEQYVATVIEAAPIGTIATTLAVAYLAAWFFEVWINRWMAEALLRKLGASDHEIARGYLTRQGVTRPNRDWIVAKEYTVYVHGPGRIGIQGWQERQAADTGLIKREERFANYTFLELFQTLLTDSEADLGFLEELQRQLRAYYYTLNVAVALAAALMLWAHNWAASPERMKPVIAASVASRQGVDLAAKLTTGSTQPALLVAASGGGTRAALYTAHALHGLHELGLAKDVVLLSGASGGGAALAAFADRYDGLMQSVNMPASQTDPWLAFEQAVTAPFISDVLDGINELRIAYGVSMGQLLAESMERRLYGRHTFGDLERAARDDGNDAHPALILNSTVSGHPAAYSAALNEHAAWRDTRNPCAAFETPFGWLAGERLVYTNLGVDSFALPERAELPDVNFRFTVVNDPKVELAQAAALNANFPPVFPNAKVTVARALSASNPPVPCPLSADAYFVTDGGATENLSLISALVALRDTLGKLTPDQWEKLRPLHVVAIEASAVDYEYSQDRGIGAATGGSKERLAGGVTELLLDGIDETLRAHEKPKLKLHFLPLPLAFRSRGGFGTHWMYAQTIRISNPLPVEIPAWYQPWLGCGEGGCRVTLDQKDIAALWSGLFKVQGGFCAATLEMKGQAVSQDAQTVQRWVCGGRLDSDPVTGIRKRSDLQVEEWERMVKGF